MADLTTGLVMHYTMDNISGNTLYDETSNDYDLTLSGSPPQVTGIVGNKSLAFEDGDYAYRSTHPGFDNNLAISLWAKFLVLGSNSAYHSIFVISNSAPNTGIGLVRSYGNSRIHCTIGRSGSNYAFSVHKYNNASEGFSPTIGKWHHFVYQFRSSDSYFELWVDGEKILGKTFSIFGSGNQPNPVIMGKSVNGQMECLLDQVRVYNLTTRGGLLTQDDIHALFAERYSDWGQDLCSGGTASADSEWSSSYSADKAFDDSETTRWSASGNDFPDWIKYDFGEGNPKVIEKVKIKAWQDNGQARIKDFTIQGSNDDSTWTTLTTQVHPNNQDWHEYVFWNKTPYRYIRINITSTYDNQSASLYEVEMYQNNTGWLPDFGNRKFLYVDSSKIDANLTYFPVTLFLKSTDWDDVFTELGSNKKKIAITTSDGNTQLFGEIEQWDDTNKKGVVHISRDFWVISSSSHTYFYFYYDKYAQDNSDHIGEIGDTPSQKVWNSNYAAVYHLCQDPTGGTDSIKDSTSNTNHGTPQGSMTSGDLVDSQVGKALDFDGSDDYIDCGNDSSLNPTTEMTIETVIKGQVETGSSEVFTVARDDSSGRAYGLGFRGSKIMLQINGAPTIKEQAGQTSVSNNTNYFVAAKGNSTLGWKTWLNGSYDGGSATWSAPNSVNSNTNIARRSYSGAEGYFDGLIDEVRISNTARSNAWLKATYYSLFNNLIYESTSTPKSVSDTGSGSDTLPSLAASLSVTDSGSGETALSIAVSILNSLFDTGEGSDVVSHIGVTLSEEDAGVGIDALTISLDISISDSGSGEDAVNVIQEIFKQVLDSASGLDSISPSIFVPIVDQGEGQESLSFPSPVLISISDVANHLDQFQITTLTSIQDSGIGASGINVFAGVAKYLRFNLKVVKKDLVIQRKQFDLVIPLIRNIVKIKQ